MIYKLNNKLNKRNVIILGKIILILLFIRLLLLIKSSTLIIIVSAVIYKLIRKPKEASAYPEIHYVLAKKFSFIYKNYPEVITDAPWRIKAGMPIPIFCVIKDAHLFPINLRGISVLVQGKGFRFETPLQYPDDRIMKVISSLNPGRNITPKKGFIDSPYWYTLGYIDIPEDYAGLIEIVPKIELVSKNKYRFRRNPSNKHRIIYTDNIPMLSHAPLRTYISENNLPTFDGWYYGDVHYHSDRTDNPTEFGAPPIVARCMGRAIGLKWTTITDHSYDLDTPVNQFYGIDLKKNRWKSLTEEIALTNSLLDNFLLIRGEEISCGNVNNENIHLLAYRVPEFIPGRGDGCKDQDSLFDFSNPPDIMLTEALEKINKKGGFAFAAHPDENSHRFARYFLNRGMWENEDLRLDKCTGLQMWYSCGPDDNFEKSYSRWIKLLLAGYKKYAIAGSDSHGDFNRYRYVRHPFFKVKESMDAYFGTPRTSVYCGAKLNQESILDGLSKGRTALTNGPLAIFELIKDNGEKAILGETISGKKFELMLKIKSTDEFGKLQKAVIYKGNSSDSRETIWKKIDFADNNERYSHSSKHPIEIEQNCYLRIEASSKKEDQVYRCLTNPIWVENQKR